MALKLYQWIVRKVLKIYHISKWLFTYIFFYWTVLIHLLAWTFAENILRTADLGNVQSNNTEFWSIKNVTAWKITETEKNLLHRIKSKLKNKYSKKKKWNLDPFLLNSWELLNREFVESFKALPNVIFFFFKSLKHLEYSIYVISGWPCEVFWIEMWDRDTSEVLPIM